MAPILINVAASLAGNVIDGISEHFSQHHGARKAGKVAEADFGAELAKSQTVASAASAAPMDTQGALVNQVLGRPEVATALAGANPAQPVQVEMSAVGGVSLRNAHGELRALKVSDDTRALVAKLYTAHQSATTTGKTAPVVLAIDPTHAASPAWSSLPARAA